MGNQIRTTILLAVLTALILWIGQVLGGRQGMIIALIFAAGMNFFSYWYSDKLVLRMYRAREVMANQAPELHEIVQRLTQQAGLPMPRIYIIPQEAPNAFATGRNPKNASVAVTAGLLGRLNRDELQGVIAHEISHIVHRDILFVTLAGIMLGSIVLLSQVFLRGMFYSSMAGSRRRYSGGGKGGGQAQLVMLIIAIVAAILAPIMAYLLYFALSRRREYLADAGAARLTRYPEGLASALEKIAGDPSPQLATVNKVTAPMYIVNPFKKKSQMKLSDLTSTHPPISERIRILRNMTHGASFKQYSDAFTNVTHKKTVVPVAALNQKEDVALRQAGPEETKKDRIDKQMRQVGDIMRKVNQFVFLTCVCGLKLKIPPNFKGDSVKCPRCQRTLDIPSK